MSATNDTLRGCDGGNSLSSGHGLTMPEVTRRIIARFAEAPGPTPPAPVSSTASPPREMSRSTWRKAAPTPTSHAHSASREATVKSHVSDFLLKLGPNSRVQAAIATHETGLVTPARHDK